MPRTDRGMLSARLKRSAWIGIWLTMPLSIGAQELPVREARIELRIGSLDDPASTFAWISAMAPTETGGVLVADALGKDVLEYAADGSLIRRFGRSGQGPGEYLTPARLGIRGGRVWVMDEGQRRVIYFDRTGAHSSTVALRFSDHGGWYRVATPSGLLTDSTYVSRLSVPSLLPGGRPDRLPIVALSSDGATLDTLAWFEDGRAYLEVRNPSQPYNGLSMLQPFGYQTRWVPLAEIGGIILAELVNEPRDLIRMMQISADGDTLWSRELPFDPIPLEENRFREVMDSLAGRVLNARGPGARTPGEARDLLEKALYRPENLPSVTGLVVAGSDAFLIQRESAPEGEPQRWTYFRAGHPVADVVVPPGVQVMAARGTVLWGVLRGDFDVQYVVKLRWGLTQPRR